MRPIYIASVLPDKRSGSRSLCVNRIGCMLFYSYTNFSGCKDATILPDIQIFARFARICWIRWLALPLHRKLVGLCSGSTRVSYALCRGFESRPRNKNPFFQGGFNGFWPFFQDCSFLPYKSTPPLKVVSHHLYLASLYFMAYRGRQP